MDRRVETFTTAMSQENRGVLRPADFSAETNFARDASGNRTSSSTLRVHTTMIIISRFEYTRVGGSNYNKSVCEKRDVASIFTTSNFGPTGACNFLEMRERAATVSGDSHGATHGNGTIRIVRQELYVAFAH